MVDRGCGDGFISDSSQSNLRRDPCGDRGVRALPRVGVVVTNFGQTKFGHAVLRSWAKPFVANTNTAVGVQVLDTQFAEFRRIPQCTTLVVPHRYRDR